MRNGQAAVVDLCDVLNSSPEAFGASAPVPSVSASSPSGTTSAAGKAGKRTSPLSLHFQPHSHSHKRSASQAQDSPLPVLSPSSLSTGSEGTTTSSGLASPDMTLKGTSEPHNTSEQEKELAPWENEQPCVATLSMMCPKKHCQEQFGDYQSLLAHLGIDHSSS